MHTIICNHWVALPNGMLDEFALETGKARSELKYRMQLAEAYPTDGELATAVASFDSWTQLRKSLKKKSDDEDTEDDSKLPHSKPSPNQNTRFPALRLILSHVHTRPVSQ